METIFAEKNISKNKYTAPLKYLWVQKKITNKFHDLISYLNKNIDANYYLAFIFFLQKYLLLSCKNKRI